MNFKFNYVYFNSGTYRSPDADDEYYGICLEDLKGIAGIEVVSYPLYYRNINVRRIFYLFQKLKIKFLNRIWFPYYFKNTFHDEKPICFIVSCDYVSPEYLRYLKNKYPRCRIVKLFRDLVKIWEERSPEFIDCKDELFDLILSIDADECKKFSMIHFNEIGSYVPVENSANYPITDVFFAGKAKDRLDKLYEAYDIITASGYKCYFYLTEVPLDQRKCLDGIVYADHPMSYKEMLFNTVNSRCILEINQEGAIGYTSRFLEAITYNKPLITNNTSIRESDFFNPDYIQCIDKITDLDPSFISKTNGFADYNYRGEFSPIHLIEKIDSLL